ncbi:hypothetical protein L208DRAFT_1473409 [Tricholoma matsutake]|nr:hypothetical protein L208DRAFT_1473409 [Tricholoma matsutake 945]
MSRSFWGIIRVPGLASTPIREVRVILHVLDSNWFSFIYVHNRPKEVCIRATSLAKGNLRLELYYILQELGAHLAKGNPKRKL